MYPQIYANRPAASVMSNILGPRPQIRYIRSNTLVGDTSDRQVVHKVNLNFLHSAELMCTSLADLILVGLLVRPHVSPLPHSSQHLPRRHDTRERLHRDMAWDTADRRVR